MPNDRIVFAFTADRVKALLDGGRLDRKRDTVVVWNPGCALRLRDQGYTPAFAHASLRGEDFTQTVADARRLAAHWWKPFFGEIRTEGVCIADAMRRDMWFALFAARNASIMVERMVAATGSVSALAYGSYAFPTFWDPPSGPWPDVADAATRYALERLGCDVEVVDVRQCPAHHHSEPKGLEEVRQVLDSRRGRRNVAICNELDYMKISNMVDDPEDWVLGRIDAYVDQPQPPSFAWYDFLSNFPVAEDVASAVDRQREAFELWRVSPECGDDILSNPYLDFQFNGFAERLKLGSRIVAAATWLFRELTPERCLLGLDAYGPGVLLNRAAKKCGVRTASVLHGTISSHFTQYTQLESEADEIVVEGDYHARQFVKMGRKAESIKVARIIDDKPLEKANAGERGNVLLVTSLTAYGLSLPMADPDQLLRDWECLLALSERRQDLHFVIKAHPRYDHLSLYRQVAERSGGRIRLEREKSLAEALKDARVAVLVAMPSGATLEILSAQVPIIYLRSSLLDAPEFDSPLKEGGVLCADSVEELDGLLDKLMKNGSARENAIDEGNSLLADLRSPVVAYPK